MRSSSALLLVTVLAFVSASPTGQDRPRIWALLVAGSMDYINYRHQADVCHAYQVLHQHGIPDEQIVVMMYNDIANDPKNPTTGKILNHPDGPNVYDGILLDYTDVDVTPPNFLNILQGNTDSMKGIGTGKVIASSAEDHIFVYYVGHGAYNLINFPNDYLRSYDLVKTLTKMHDQKKFAQLVFYLDAGESGSMFERSLPKDINVYAMTSAGFRQPSFACYYDKLRRTFLGDVFSVSWMEDSDAKDLTVETLQEQYQIVKSKTPDSTVQEFGNVEMSGKLVVADFMGPEKPPAQMLPEATNDAVPAHEVGLEVLKKSIQSSHDANDHAKLVDELEQLTKARALVDSMMAGIAKTFKLPEGGQDNVLLDSPDPNCYHKIVDYFHEVCFNLQRNSYVLRHLTVFAEICRDPRSERSDEVLKTLDRVCDHKPTLDIV